MAVISVDDRSVIIGRVLGDGANLETEAAPYSMDDLRETSLAVRSELLSALESMPDGGFDAQPVDAEGNEVWSAGQVVSHISQSLNGLGVRALDMAGVEHSGPDPQLQALAGTQLLSREQARQALAIGDEQIARLYELIPEDTDFTKRVEHPFFGSVGIQGWLLFLPLHENIHVEQLNQIAEANA